MPAIWTGTVSFGLVAIPVSVVPAVREGRVSFHLLHDKDAARLRRRLYCPADEKILEREETVRGYEITPDQWVIIEEEEIQSLRPERSQTIEILDFVGLDEIEPIYYDRPYYLVPGKGGDKPYRLLAMALEKTGKAGIAQFVMHDREYLVALRSIDQALCIITMHYSEEKRSSDEYALKPRKVSQAEARKIADPLKKLPQSFKPENYSDEYRERLLDAIQQKREVQGTVEAPETEETEAEETPDLLSALEESLAKARK